MEELQNFRFILYERVSYEDTKKKISSFLLQLSNCKKETTYIDLCKEIISIQNHIEQMYDYADIRNMRDLKDPYFEKEIDYWNLYKPKFDLLFLPFYKEVMASSYLDALIKVMPANFFTTISYESSITSDFILSLEQKEKQLISQYRNLNRDKILFEGEEKTISSIAGFFSHKDRNIRKKAHDAVNDYYYKHSKEYSQLFLDLISVRNEIASKLGFDNYVSYSLRKRRRFGYDYTDISRFREYVILYVVPICDTLSKWQREELGLENLRYYDSVFFTEMPTLLHHGKELLEKFATSSYKLDSSFGDLFSFMIQNDYIDLVSQDDKVNFAITNYLTETCFPTITGNFKNNYTDLKVTSHEMGHAFQKYCASKEDKTKIVSALLKYPTMEIAEMFSYAMELIALPVVRDMFSSSDYFKYCFMEFYSLISNLPYICLVDEFQETLYSRKNLSREDIGTIWLELTKKYHLERSNSGHINLDTGGYFYRQTHIYTDPFYYIDYALSYFGAISIWNGCKSSLEMFQKIGSVASYYPLDTLIDKYSMPNPFDEKVVKDTVETLYRELSFYKEKINVLEKK